MANSTDGLSPDVELIISIVKSKTNYQDALPIINLLRDMGLRTRNFDILAEVESLREQFDMLKPRVGAAADVPYGFSSLEERAQAQRRGARPKAIFNAHVDKSQMAAVVAAVYNKYNKVRARRIVIENRSYDVTDFLIAIYHACVELELSPERMSYSRWHEFLQSDCKLTDLESSEKYRQRLNQVTQADLPLHRLTRETLFKLRPRYPQLMPPDDLPYWQEMAETAKAILTSQHYIKSLREA